MNRKALITPQPWRKGLLLKNIPSCWEFVLIYLFNMFNNRERRKKQMVGWLVKVQTHKGYKSSKG